MFAHSAALSYHETNQLYSTLPKEVSRIYVPRDGFGGKFSKEDAKLRVRRHSLRIHNNRVNIAAGRIAS